MEEYSKLGISNDFMFGRIMENPAYCKLFPEQILNIRIDHVEIPERRKTIDEKMDARSIRPDICMNDGKTIYNCEMQRIRNRALPKRSRYYQSQIDIRCMTKQ